MRYRQMDIEIPIGAMDVRMNIQFNKLIHLSMFIPLRLLKKSESVPGIPF